LNWHGSSLEEVAVELFENNITGVGDGFAPEARSQWSSGGGYLEGLIKRGRQRRNLSYDSRRTCPANRRLCFVLPDKIQQRNSTGPGSEKFGEKVVAGAKMASPCLFLENSPGGKPKSSLGTLATAKVPKNLIADWKLAGDMSARYWGVASIYSIPRLGVSIR
jgi:hypothetical protein